MVDVSYPRDLKGYGETPPHAQWPGGARIAVQFVLNYEEGGENNILHGDAGPEMFLSEIVNAPDLPGQRHMSMEQIYEYGSRAGVWRLLRLFDKHDIKLTVFAVAEALARYPEMAEAFMSRGHEIACHGLKWINYQHMPIEEERRHIAEACKIIKDLTGHHPSGWYTGRTSPNTRALVAEHGGFEYDADDYSDDLPHWVEVGGQPQLIVPYTLDTNDMRFATVQGFNSGDQFFSFLKDAFDVLYAEGGDKPKMLSIGLHCRLVGRPARIAALSRFIDYIKSHDHVWIPRRVDIARHWRAVHPYQGSGNGNPDHDSVRTDSPQPARHSFAHRPSQMTEAEFLRTFAEIYEDSPWVAAAVWPAARSGDLDSVGAMHIAMQAAVGAAGGGRQMALIKAHPDLAGKAAVAGTLTKASTAEQKGAGLDRLTDEQFQRFTRLNTQYMARFGFPFIIAVKGHDASSILAAFERRIGHSVEDETAEALSQIHRIAGFRLEALAARPADI